MANGAPTDRRRRAGLSEWAVRVCYGIVFIVNVMCAIQFIVAPGSFAASYELSGIAGEVAIQGIGIAFLMWNTTYPAVIAAPGRFRSLAIVVIAQQIIGLVGESWLLLTLPAGHETLAASITRFIAFDAAGLVIMAIALICLLKNETRS